MLHKLALRNVENIKGIIRSRSSKKNRQYDGHKKKNRKYKKDMVNPGQICIFRVLLLIP
jgi:hypothetical protein